MKRDRNLEQLKGSLHETQDILDKLIAETSAELGKQWDGTRSEASGRLKVASKRLDKRYGKARAQLDKTLRKSSTEAEKLYAHSRKDAEKKLTQTRRDLEKNYSEARKRANKRLVELKGMANERKNELKLRGAGLMQAIAATFLAGRNRLEPKQKMALRNEKDKHFLGKGGGFKRFIAIALIIVAKKDRILSLGQQLYSKLQDADARQALKDDAREQVDTMRRLMKAYANGHYREFPYMSIVKIIAAVVYFVSVADLIPDFIPVLGLTDDLAILAWVYSSVKDDMQQFVDWEEANERRREKMEQQKVASKSATTAADRDATPGSTAARSASSNTSSQAATATATTGGTGAQKDSAASGSTGGSGSNTASGSTTTSAASNNSKSGGNSSNDTKGSAGSNTTGNTGTGDKNSSSGGSASRSTGGTGSSSGNSGSNK